MVVPKTVKITAAYTGTHLLYMCVQSIYEIRYPLDKKFNSEMSVGFIFYNLVDFSDQHGIANSYMYIALLLLLAMCGLLEQSYIKLYYFTMLMFMCVVFSVFPCQTIFSFQFQGQAADLSVQLM